MAELFLKSPKREASEGEWPALWGPAPCQVQTPLERPCRCVGLPRDIALACRPGCSHACQRPGAKPRLTQSQPPGGREHPRGQVGKPAWGSPGRRGC